MRQLNAQILILLLTLLYLALGPSCSHRYYLPRVPEGLPAAKAVTLKVGQKRKVLSDPIFSLKEPTSAAALIQSSDNSIVEVQYVQLNAAWIVAKKPGSVVLRYLAFSSEPEMVTRISVED